jgi:Flp pilus assembly protein TadG
VTAPGRRDRAADRGTGGVEVAIAVTALMAVLFFIVGALRITTASGDVAAAARAGARAAAAERSNGAASSAARSITATMLASRGVACSGGPGVSVSGDLSAGGVVSVSVTCTVSLEDVVLAGFPGSRTVSGSAVEYVDSVRGGGG